MCRSYSRSSTRGGTLFARVALWSSPFRQLIGILSISLTAATSAGSPAEGSCAEPPCCVGFPARVPAPPSSSSAALPPDASRGASLRLQFPACSPALPLLCCSCGFPVRSPARPPLPAEPPAPGAVLPTGFPPAALPAAWLDSPGVCSGTSLGRAIFLARLTAHRGHGSKLAVSFLLSSQSSQ